MKAKYFKPMDNLSKTERKQVKRHFKNQWYTTEEACKLLVVSRLTMRYYRLLSIVRHKKDGGKFLYNGWDVFKILCQKHPDMNLKINWDDE